jgi:hypothetical protein
MQTKTESRSPLARIMIVSSCLAAGFVLASLEALRPNFAFKVSARTALAFVGGSVLLYVYWKIILHPSQAPGQRRLRQTSSALLILSGLAAFLYPIRFIAPNSFGEVAVGLVMAFAGVAGVTLLLFVCKRFLDRDTHDNIR